jgi:hypothetical protein
MYLYTFQEREEEKGGKAVKEERAYSLTHKHRLRRKKLQSEKGETAVCFAYTAAGQARYTRPRAGYSSSSRHHRSRSGRAVCRGGWAPARAAKETARRGRGPARDRLCRARPGTRQRMESFARLNCFLLVSIGEKARKVFACRMYSRNEREEYRD